MSHINGTTGSPLLQTLLQGTERTAAKERTSEASKTTESFKTSAEVRADHAALSTTGGALAASATGNDTDVRSGKVEALRASIADGSYQVPASALADKLIENLLR